MDDAPPTRSTPSGAPRTDPARRREATQRGSSRDQIANLRVTLEERAQKNLVRVLYPEADSEAELAYRIWRRGLQVDLARLASMGEALPPGMTERHLAMLVTQDLLACVPLLNRAGTLQHIVDMLTPHAEPPTAVLADALDDDAPGAIDPSASESVAAFGADDFL